MAIALLAAAGVVLVFHGLTVPPRPRRRYVRTLLEGAGWASVPPLRFALVIATAGAGGLLVGSAFFGPGPAALLPGLVCAWAPVAAARRAAARRRVRLREAWPDAIAHLVASLRAGGSLGRACADLATKGPTELRWVFEAFARPYRAGASFPEAVDAAVEVAADPIADRVLIALKVAYEVGSSNVIEVLSALAASVRDEIDVQREVRARWSWTVSAARLAAGAPWVVLVLMLTRPEAAEAYASSGGLTVLAVGAIATLLGYRAMLAAARLEELERLR